MRIVYRDLKKMIKLIVSEQFISENQESEVAQIAKQIASSLQKFEGKYRIKPVLNTPDNKQFDVMIESENIPLIFKDMIELAREEIQKLGFKPEKSGTYSGTFYKGNLEIEMNKISNGFTVQVFLRDPLVSGVKGRKTMREAGDKKEFVSGADACHACHGRGYIRREFLPDDKGSWGTRKGVTHHAAEECPACKGTGKSATKSNDLNKTRPGF
jgi:hypothetical protein